MLMFIEHMRVKWTRIQQKGYYLMTSRLALLSRSNCEIDSHSIQKKTNALEEQKIEQGDVH